MKLKMPKLKEKAMSESSLKLRIISGLLFVSSGISCYFSRREAHSYEYDPSLALSRIFIPGSDPASISVYYIWIWELLGLAILLFVIALTMLIISFKKPLT